MLNFIYINFHSQSTSRSIDERLLFYRNRHDILNTGGHNQTERQLRKLLKFFCDYRKERTEQNAVRRSITLVNVALFHTRTHLTIPKTKPITHPFFVILKFHRTNARTRREECCRRDAILQSPCLAVCVQSVVWARARVHDHFARAHTHIDTRTYTRTST